MSTDGVGAKVLRVEFDLVELHNNPAPYPIVAFGFILPGNSSYGDLLQYASGAWLSTNVLAWLPEISLTAGQTPKFGFQLTGPAGETQKFRMFIPQAAVDQMSEVAGATLTGENMGVYFGSNLTQYDITETTGGYLVNLSFSANSSSSTLLANIETPITVRPSSSGGGSTKGTLSLSITPSEATKGSDVTLSGNYSSGGAQKIRIKCTRTKSKGKGKKKNNNKRSKVYKAKTDTAGNYTKTIKAKATMKCVAKKLKKPKAKSSTASFTLSSSN